MRKLVLPIITAALVAGCSGGLVRPRVEDGIRKALPDYIGPAKEYTVQADGSTKGIIGGAIKRLHIEGRDVQVDPQLLVSRMVIDMEGVRFDPKTRKLTSVESTVFQGIITEAVVNQYIAKVRKADSGLSAKLEPGKVSVQFVPSVAGVNVPISVIGIPEVVGGDKVNFTADKASVSRLPVPAFLVNKVLDGLNPILDMSALRFPVTLSGITVQKGTVVIKGNAQIMPVSARK